MTDKLKAARKALLTTVQMYAPPCAELSPQANEALERAMDALQDAVREVVYGLSPTPQPQGDKSVDPNDVVGSERVPVPDTTPASPKHVPPPQGYKGPPPQFNAVNPDNIGKGKKK